MNLWHDIQSFNLSLSPQTSSTTLFSVIPEKGKLHHQLIWTERSSYNFPHCVVLVLCSLAWSEKSGGGFRKKHQWVVSVSFIGNTVSKHSRKYKVFTYCSLGLFAFHYKRMTQAWIRNYENSFRPRLKMEFWKNED